MSDAKTHWENVYQAKQPNEVSWFQTQPTLSLDLIARSIATRPANIIDIGGGASVLVDSLLDNHFGNVTVLDVSAQALAASKARLGKRAAQVNWIESDITRVQLPKAAYDVWHDRAMFHFLTRASSR
jgi:ubiquinone/menaquinone biosynthesis C-methylase UbiE